MSFNVKQLGDRSFRFLVASNHVGHFIYGLKDRVWPNFVCHFRLFKTSVDYAWDGSEWHLDDVIPEVSARSPMAIRSPLGFLRKNVQGDTLSRTELAKFNLVPANISSMSMSDQDLDIHNLRKINLLKKL